MSIVTGAIKVIDVPDDACVTTVRELVLQLEKYLAVEFDVEQITNVVVSSSEPDTTDRQVLWFRIDNAGNFLGIFVFVQGEWLQMFPAVNQITRMYGDSRDIPPGYELITKDTPGFNLPMASHLQGQWKAHDSNEYWIIFDVVYVGL